MTPEAQLALIALGENLIKNIVPILTAVGVILGLIQSRKNSKKADELAVQTEANTVITQATKEKAEKIDLTTIDLKEATKKIDKQTNHTLDELRRIQTESDKKIEDLQRMIVKLVDGGDSTGVLDSAIKRKDESQ